MLRSSMPSSTVHEGEVTAEQGAFLNQRLAKVLWDKVALKDLGLIQKRAKLVLQLMNSHLPYDNSDFPPLPIAVEDTPPPVPAQEVPAAPLQIVVVVDQPAVVDAPPPEVAEVVPAAAYVAPPLPDVVDQAAQEVLAAALLAFADQHFTLHVDHRKPAGSKWSDGEHRHLVLASRMLGPSNCSLIKRLYFQGSERSSVRAIENKVRNMKRDVKANNLDGYSEDVQASLLELFPHAGGN
ncbi:unnamed protein product [Linum tenue]|uniref:Uncharacterized protein n=1 Tax=Linum tenue TaxID=586396 RepID=A0AAV0HHQ6_9ROSI|nr:unnamed protein product [Linum tenue]